MSTTDSPTWQQVRDRWIAAKAAHLAIREVLPREHPDRMRSKANYVESHEAWRAIYKSN